MYIIQLQGSRHSEYKGTQYVREMKTGYVVTEMIPTPEMDHAAQYLTEEGVNQDAEFLARGGHIVKVVEI